MRITSGSRDVPEPDPQSPSPMRCLPPSESVGRAAGTFMSGTKSWTKTMHAFTLIALFSDVWHTPPADSGVKAG
ncbi:MAG: hypothetical protein PHP79_11165, partial [Clostridia bacterium]|nr:hypothetical protein [Clostridia bacterium]